MDVYLLLKFHVCSPSITRDENVLKLVILLTLSKSKMMDSLLIQGRSRIIVIFTDFGQVKNDGHFVILRQVEIIRNKHKLFQPLRPLAFF